MPKGMDAMNEADLIRAYRATDTADLDRLAQAGHDATGRTPARVPPGYHQCLDCIVLIPDLDHRVLCRYDERKRRAAR